jgi:hypothetical protein
MEETGTSQKNIEKCADIKDNFTCTVQVFTNITKHPLSIKS